MFWFINNDSLKKSLCTDVLLAPYYCKLLLKTWTHWLMSPFPWRKWQIATNVALMVFSGSISDSSGLLFWEICISWELYLKNLLRWKCMSCSIFSIMSLNWCSPKTAFNARTPSTCSCYFLLISKNLSTSYHVTGFAI